jgi:hypothetical protein
MGLGTATAEGRVEISPALGTAVEQRPGAPDSGQKPPIEQIIRNLAVIAAMFCVVGFLTSNSYLYLLGCPISRCCGRDSS